MSAVTVQEIVKALRKGIPVGAFRRFDLLEANKKLVERIEQHGIAPPDGLELIADIEGIGCCTVIIRNGRVHIASETVRDIVSMGAGKLAPPPDGMMLVKRDNELLEDIEFLLSQKMSAECCNAAFPVKSLTRVLESCKAMLAAAPEAKP